MDKRFLKINHKHDLIKFLKTQTIHSKAVQKHKLKRTTKPTQGHSYPILLMAQGAQVM